MLKLSFKDSLGKNQVEDLNVSTELEANLCFPLLMPPQPESSIPA